MKKIWTKALAYVLVVTMCLSAVNVPVYAQENTVTEVLTENETTGEAMLEEATVSGNDAEPTTENVESTEEVTTDGNDGSTWDQTTTENVFEGENYKVAFTLTSNWDAGYNANVKLENTGDSTIQNWYLGFDYNNSIINIWNAEVSSNEGNEYVIKNVGWNQDIAADSSIEFGISGEHAFKGFPENYELIGTSTEVTEDDYAIQYVADGDWGTGFYGSIVVTNNTDTALEDWVLEFDFDREITEIWDGVIEKHEDNHYVVRNAEYNSTIMPGESVSIGIKGCEGESGDEPINYMLYSYSQTSDDMNKDSDSDKVPDWVEIEFGSDIMYEDTDEDRISDYDEIFNLSTNPANRDTDEDGILDGDEDFDNDGIINIDEFTNKTNPLSADTDGDYIEDNEEYKYGTNPTLEDTDGDGTIDGVEIELNTDPLVFDDEFFVTRYASEEDTVKVSVSVMLSGEEVDTLTVKKYEDEFLFPKSMPGYIGSAYNFKVDGTFDKATINFEFDENLLANSEFEPVIYYFNESTQLLEELETSVSGNIALTEVTHFSKYILLNRKVFQDSFEWQDTWESDHKFTDIEIVFVVDDSGSMDWNDPSYERLAVARTLIDNLPSGSKIGLVRFDGGWPKTEALTSSLTTDKEEVKNYLTTEYFYNPGGTDMYNGIQKAFPLYESAEDTTLKMMIVLSDGVTDDTYLHSTVVSTANKNNIRIYTVGLGSSTSYFNSYMKPLANNTGASFYLASDATQLADIYKDINKKIDIETDSDKDGIADYYEDNLVLFNGTTIKLDKNDPDSDDDGVNDGIEVSQLNYRYNEDRTKVIVTGKLNSNPLSIDSDGDGINDDLDTAPMEKGLAGGIVGKLNLVSCYNYEGAGWTSGHTFFVYTSYINDNVDFSTLAAGWSKVDSNKIWSWDNLKYDSTLQSNYPLRVGESVAIGNGAFGTGWFGIGNGSGSSGSSGDSSGSSGSGTSGSGSSSGNSSGNSSGSANNTTQSGTGEENGVCYNMEVYKHYYSNYNYLSNTYISEDITEDELKELISYCGKGSVNYWSLTHNCAEVACNAWNLISDVTVSPYNSEFMFGTVATPNGLKINLRTLPNSAEDYSLENALKY